MIWKAMGLYLQKHWEGKKFHDPLAACCALDSSIMEWAEVDVYRSKGQWGSKRCEGTNTWISIVVDHAKFQKTFLGVS
jgi:pyrimidine-specific ribonucleoside hydrolase